MTTAHGTSDALFDPVHNTSDPNRFWTLANTGEVTPGVLAALDWSVWDNFELAVRQAWCDLGIMRKKDVYLPADPNIRQTSTFYGRHALNVDYVREFMGSVPGASPNDFERDVCGTLRSGMSDKKGSLGRLPAMLLALPGAYRRTGLQLEQSHTTTREWWQREVLHGAGGTEPVAELRDACTRFRDTMSLHIRVRTFLQGVQGALVGMADRAGRPDLALTVFAGFGEVSEATLAEDVWALGKDRISMAEFLERHGYYGPNEGMVWTKSWREDQAPLRKLLESVSARPATETRERANAASTARQAAEEELLAALPRTRRGLARVLFGQAAAQVRNLEMGKATYHMALDGCRAAARRVGNDLSRRRMIVDSEDVFFLTIEEIERPPAHLAELVEYRRAQRADYLTFDLPMTFYGVPEPVTFVDHGNEVTEVTGIGAGNGVVEGRARVLHDADDSDTDTDLLENGDILVCRTTNPSWTPVLALVDAVVIDIGSTASHGAIVARELGIPCVINTGNGSRVIRSGDRIRVDGANGVVTILERSRGHTPSEIAWGR